MITPGYAQTMAAYNAEMNRRLYAAASRLPDAERRADRGAFWGSIHGTLNHLLWADQTWMSRFAGWDKPRVAIKESATLYAEFDPLAAARAAADANLQEWTQHLGQDWLDGELSWFSGATQREMKRRRDVIVMHFFNHQTHHRGQAHALLTAAGETTGDTDLPWVLPQEAVQAR